MQQHRQPPNQQRTIGEYAYGSRLGSGTYGEVFLGTHLNKPNETVAIKEIMLAGRNSKELRYLYQELRLMSIFDHPNVLRLLSSIEIKNIKICLILELCKGGDLQQFLRSKEDPQKNRALSEDLARDFICQISAGLKYLHERNVIHRDLKPANILMTENLQLKISDFGFARESTKNDLYNSHVGTPLYMAPEVWSASTSFHYTSKCDIWSAGVIFYEMLTGYHPIKLQQIMTQPSELKAQVQNAALQIPYPSHISALCVSLMKCLLAKKPIERYNWDQFFAHPYLSPANMSQSTLALQRFGEGEDIILPEVQKKLIENTARLHTITLLSRHHYSETVQIGLRDDETLHQIKSYVGGQAQIDPAQLILTDQNGDALDDYNRLASYNKAHFFLFAIDVFEQQQGAVAAVVGHYKNMNPEMALPITWPTQQTTPTNQAIERAQHLKGLYEVIKIRTESVSCAVRDFTRHVHACRVALLYLTNDVRRIQARYQNYKDLFNSQKTDILQLIEGRTSHLQKLQVTELDPAFQTPNRKKLIDLVPKPDIDLYGRLEGIYKQLEHILNSNQGPKVEAPLKITDEMVLPTQTILEKAKKVLLVETKQKNKRYEGLLETALKSGKHDDLVKLNSLFFEINDHDVLTSRELIKAYKVKVDESLNLITIIANYVAELRRSQSSTAQLVVQVSVMIEELQRCFIAGTNIADLGTGYNDCIDQIHQRKTFTKDLQTCVVDHTKLFNVLSEKIALKQFPLSSDRFEKFIPELFVEWPRPSISLPIFEALPKLAHSGDDEGFEMVENKGQTLETKLAEHGSLITSITSMLSVPDLKASTLAIAPMQQVEMLQSQIEHMENQLSKGTGEQDREAKHRLQELVKLNSQLRGKLEDLRDEMGHVATNDSYSQENLKRLESQVAAGREACSLLFMAPEVKSLMALTDLKADKAKQLLEANGNDVERAVNAFFAQ